MIALLGGLRLLCGFAAVWFFPACSCGYLVLVYLVIVVGLCWWVCCVNCCGLLDVLVIVIACDVILALLMLIFELGVCSLL